MLFQNKLVPTLLVALATTGVAVPAAAEAKATKAATPAAILKDCKKDQEISKRYRLADLKKAKKAIKTSGQKANCRAAVGSAIGALSGKKGKNSTSAIVKECKKAGGISHKYSLATLKKAYKTLPADIRDYTSCGGAINSQINSLK